MENEFCFLESTGSVCVIGKRRSGKTSFLQYLSESQSNYNIIKINIPFYLSDENEDNENSFSGWIQELIETNSSPKCFFLDNIDVKNLNALAIFMSWAIENKTKIYFSVSSFTILPRNMLSQIDYFVVLSHQYHICNKVRITTLIPENHLMILFQKEIQFVPKTVLQSIYSVKQQCKTILTKLCSRTVIKIILSFVIPQFVVS